MNKQDEKFTPFYKEPLMFLIAGVPVVAVILGFVILNLAMSSKDSLVSDSYYKDGVSYTETIDAANKAIELNIKGTLNFTDSEVYLDLSGNFENEPDSVQLLLIHPTLQDRDVDIFMQRISDGKYAGALELALPDRRNIWLQNAQHSWRVRTTETIASGKVITLQAQ